LAVVLLEEQIRLLLAQLLGKPAVLAAVDRRVILLMRQAKTLVLELLDKAQPVVVVRHEGQIQLTLLVVVAVLVGQVPQAQPTTIQVVLEHSLAEFLETVVMGVNCLLAALLSPMAAAAAVVWVELLQLIQQALELAAQAAAATVEWPPLELLAAPILAAVAAVLDITERLQLVMVVEPAAAAS
jgi:hypothetical protein